MGSEKRQSFSEMGLQAIKGRRQAKATAAQIEATARQAGADEHQPASPAHHLESQDLHLDTPAFRPEAQDLRPEAAMTHPWPSYPLRTLFWECTLQCNQFCRHCGSSASSAPSKDIPAEDFLKALSILKTSLEAKGQRLPALAITGGEPLVRADLIETMSAASELGYKWGLTTNGLMLNTDTIEKLRRADMKTASISIDGFGETHDYLRNSPGSFERVVANIRSLLDVDFAREVQVTTIVNPLNISDLEPLYELLTGLQGLGSWRISSTDPIGRADTDGSLMLDAKQTREVLEFIVSHNSAKLPIKYACPSHLGEYEMRARTQPFYCFAGRVVMSILHNGDLAACPNVPRNKITTQGNIYDADVDFDLLKVWRTRYIFHRDTDSRRSAICATCDQWDECFGGSLHTFDFERNVQRKCVKEMLTQG